MGGGASGAFSITRLICPPLAWPLALVPANQGRSWSPSFIVAVTMVLSARLVSASTTIRAGAASLATTFEISGGGGGGVVGVGGY